jgi:hypothetical protein
LGERPPPTISINFPRERINTNMMENYSPQEKELYRILDEISLERTEQILKDIKAKYAKEENGCKLVCSWNIVKDNV